MNNTPTETKVNFVISSSSFLLFSFSFILPFSSFLLFPSGQNPGKNGTEKISKIYIPIQRFSVIIDRVKSYSVWLW